MVNILISILPIFIFFILGYLFGVSGFLSKTVAQNMLKAVFYFNMPAVILLSITNLQITNELIYLPISAILVHIIISVSSLIVVKRLQLENSQIGVIVIGSLIMSTSFIVPFALIFHGDNGLGLLLIFDLGNTLMSLSVAYFFAVYFGSEQIAIRKILKTFLRKFFSAPPVLALILALILNGNDGSIPSVILPTLEILKFLFTPMIMIALGIFFEPKIPQKNLVFVTIFLRMGIGMLLGFFCVYIFGLTGLERVMVLIGSGAPVGFVTIALASLEKLDIELAANIVSFAIVTGLFYIPLLFYIL